jgi:hypothetical protein
MRRSGTVAHVDELLADDAVHPEHAHLRTGEPETSAVGVPGVAVSMRYALAEMGTARSVRTLLRVNQADGFDCPSCAWGDPNVEDRKHAEFCENGAKAVAWEATRKRADAAFFAAHPVSFLREQSDHWLESNGRLTEPTAAWPTAIWWTWSASGRTASGARPRSVWSSTRRPRAAPRLTSRRRTSSSPSTPPPTRATPRRRSPSSSAWTVPRVLPADARGYPQAGSPIRP